MRPSGVGFMEDKQNDQRVQRRSACVEIMIWYETHFNSPKITRIAVIAFDRDLNGDSKEDGVSVLQLS